MHTYKVIIKGTTGTYSDMIKADRYVTDSNTIRFLDKDNWCRVMFSLFNIISVEMVD